MYVSPTSNNRVRRSTAGINKRYDEQDYVLVSFPQLNKHSIVPSASVNIDPLDKQNGSIKTFGSRKNLRIIGNGPKEVMKERASRYAVSAGSEEVELVLDEKENDEDGSNNNDDDYPSPAIRRTTKEIKKRVTTSEQSKSQIEISSSHINDQPMTTCTYDYSRSASSSQKNPLSNHQLNFDRLYPSEGRAKRSYEDNDDDASSLSGSDKTDNECSNNKNLSTIKKTNEFNSLLKKSRRKRNRKVIAPVRNEEGPCVGCIKLQEEITKLSKRIDGFEKYVPLIKKFRSKTPLPSTNQTNTIGDENQIYASIKEVTGIDPNELRSTSTCPTMIMRELIKKAGYINDRVFLKNNEKLFKEFIQMKCMIVDDNIDDQWKEIKESLGRQHIDEHSNEKKKVRLERSSALGDTTLTPLVQIPATQNDEEEASSATTTASETSQSI